ncbi:MAG: ATP-binding cassette domain-containing protein [Chthoniobacterales bacterium]
MLVQTRRAFRRLRRKPRTVIETPNLLPTLIQVFAAFTQMSGEILEEEIDSTLSFLRYDYPEGVYSELRKLFRQALHENQDLEAIANRLSQQLDDEEKILLGVQLYELISKAGLQQTEIVPYYSFMSQLGMASQAIEIVYQLNAEDMDAKLDLAAEGNSPLEFLSFGSDKDTDVFLSEIGPGEKIFAYRYNDLALLKNLSKQVLLVQGRALAPKAMARIYSNQRLLIHDRVLSYQDLMFYFNVKKGVSLPNIFVAVNDDDEVRLEKNRSRESCLDVSFGLGVQVTALSDVDATLKGKPLREGNTIEASLEDSIVFHDDSELNLAFLRRRARSLGGRFHLKHSKSEYLVSNNSSLLGEGDILLSPGTGGDVLLEIFCDYEKKVGRVEVLQADRPISVHGIPVRNSARLVDGDTIRINAGQLLRCNFSERLIEEERNIISSLEVRDLACRFSDGVTALEGMSFSAQRGELICVMGPSGSGKSSLLRALCGQFTPFQGEVLLNGRSLYASYEDLKGYFAYVPQHDAFDENLTIEENLEFASAIRFPYLSNRERIRRVDTKLAELGLNERRSSVVGSALSKKLSGGERKRLNIGLDMVSPADIYLFDEPTSGLSSKDSEHIMEIIRAISHNKIVLVTIHQPTSRVFEMFHKALLLDKGGNMVFFGTPKEMLSYFAEAEHQELFAVESNTCETCGTTRPEFIFDVLETPLRDLSGDIIYEENSRGQLVPARRFSPEYWRDKFETYCLLKDVKEDEAVSQFKSSKPETAPTSRRASLFGNFHPHNEWTQFKTLLKRSFLSKLRNNANLVITLIMAPLLAFLIGIVLRYSESEHYDFASAYHIPIYLFMSLVVAMFLGLTNSVDDIIQDRPVLLRERNLNVRLGYYVIAKTLTLSIFAIVQCALYTWLGNALLSVRGMFIITFLALFLTAMSGAAIGLIISSLASQAKIAVLIIPAVLIPQIILAGAFIKYEEMNKNLDFVYTIEKWFRQNSETSMPPRSDLQVPLICEFIPMRWSYEALVYAQARLNPLTSRQHRIQKEIRALIAKKNLSDSELERLEDLKELLAILSSLEGRNPAVLRERLSAVDRVLDGGPLDRSRLISNERGVTAEQLYINQKISDIVSRAEMEQSDYRENRHINVFFGAKKEYFGLKMNIIELNTLVLCFSTILMLCVLTLILKRQMKTRVV